LQCNTEAITRMCCSVLQCNTEAITRMCCSVLQCNTEAITRMCHAIYLTCTSLPDPPLLFSFSHPSFSPSPTPPASYPTFPPCPPPSLSPPLMQVWKAIDELLQRFSKNPVTVFSKFSFSVSGYVSVHTCVCVCAGGYVSVHTCVCVCAGTLFSACMHSKYSCSMSECAYVYTCMCMFVRVYPVITVF